MNRVKAIWAEEKEEHPPPELYAELFVDAMGHIVGMMLIYGYMRQMLEDKIGGK